MSVRAKVFKNGRTQWEKEDTYRETSIPPKVVVDDDHARRLEELELFKMGREHCSGDEGFRMAESAIKENNRLRNLFYWSVFTAGFLLLTVLGGVGAMFIDISEKIRELSRHQLESEYKVRSLEQETKTMRRTQEVHLKRLSYMTEEIYEVVQEGRDRARREVGSYQSQE